MLFHDSSKSSVHRLLVGAGLLLALAWFTFLMGRITLGYWPVRSDAGFLQIKQHYLGIDHWRIAFWVPSFSGATWRRFALRP